jgi:hypothetical protein
VNKKKKKKDKKGKSMCFRTVSREKTMIQIHEKMKANVDNKYNPNFSLVEKKALVCSI